MHQYSRSYQCFRRLLMQQKQQKIAQWNVAFEQCVYPILPYLQQRIICMK